MSSTIKELDYCQICLDPFGSYESCPRNLYCRHTFCKSCLQKLITYDLKVCPKCTGPFHFNSADGIPINFSVVESLSVTKIDGRKLTRKNLEENTFYVTKGDNEEKRYAKVKVNGDQISFDVWEDKAEEGSSCIEFFDFIKNRTSVIDTHKFIKEHKMELHNPKLPEDRIKYSKIKVKGKEVFFDSFKTSGRNDFVIEFESLLKTLGCTSVLPAEAFLKIHRTIGEFVITTDGESPRALNFVLLASGIMDTTYQGTVIRDLGTEVTAGYKQGSQLPGVVEGIQGEVIYNRRESNRGDVQGWNTVAQNPQSFFCIMKEYSTHPSISTFGRVKRGMEVVDRIVTKRGKEVDSVMECGLVLDLN